MEVIQSYLAHNGLSFLISSITWPGKAATIIGMTSTKGTIEEETMATICIAHGKESNVCKSHLWSLEIIHFLLFEIE